MFKFKNSLGVFACSSLVIGNMIGSGIFMLPTILASFGSISLIGWLITSIGITALAYIFGEFSKELSLTGGPYAYCKKYLGNFIGYHVSWSYLAATIIGNVAIIIATLSYLTTFIPEINTNHALSLEIGLAIIWLITIINILGLKTFKTIQITTTIIKLIPIIMVTLLGISHINIDYLLDFNISSQSNFSAVASCTMITLYAFAGIESSTIPTNNIENPKKTIKIATMIGALVTSMIYILSTFVLIGMFSPQSLATSNAPFAEAGEIIFGQTTNKIFAIIAVITCICTAVGFLFVSGHAAASAAKDGYLPKYMSKISNKKTPKNALITSGIIMSMLYLINYNKTIFFQFEEMLALSNIFLLIPYLCISISAIISWKNKQSFFSIITAILSCIYMLFAIWGVKTHTLQQCLIAAALMSLLYLSKNFKRTYKTFRLN